MKKFIGSAALALIFVGVSGQAFAKDSDCEALKAKIEQELKNKGDSSSYVRIYEADEKVEGKDIGLCADGKLKVVLFEVEPS